MLLLIKHVDGDELLSLPGLEVAVFLIHGLQVAYELLNSDLQLKVFLKQLLRLLLAVVVIVLLLLRHLCLLAELLF